jgi:chromosome segregation ATPase
MGPKTNKKNVQNSDSDSEESLKDMMRSMSSQLKSLNEKMEKIEVIESEVKSLKVLLNDVRNENKQQLKSEAKETEKKLKDMNERNNFLENRVNNLEQYHRSWSARALNIPLSPNEESDNVLVMNKIYNVLLLPILRGAVERRPSPPSPLPSSS